VPHRRAPALRAEPLSAGVLAAAKTTRRLRPRRGRHTATPGQSEARAPRVGSTTLVVTVLDQPVETAG
jgi:hypothetical protein